MVERHVDRRCPVPCLDNADKLHRKDQLRSDPDLPIVADMARRLLSGLGNAGENNIPSIAPVRYKADGRHLDRGNRELVVVSSP